MNDLLDGQILGYSVRSLITLAERLKRDDITPEALDANTSAYLRGYEQAHKDIHEGMRKAVLKTDTFIIEGKTPEERYADMRRTLG